MQAHSSQLIRQVYLPAMFASFLPSFLFAGDGTSLPCASSPLLCTALKPTVGIIIEVDPA